MTYDRDVKRTTIFLTEELEQLLQEAARRSRRPQAEIVREALSDYLKAKPRPWPRSVGMGANGDPNVTSSNVTEWVRREWEREFSGPDTGHD
jgi:hypothetical protein